MILRAGLANALAFDAEAGIAPDVVAPPSAPSLVGERAAMVDGIWNFEAPVVDIGGFNWPAVDENPPE